MLGFISSAKTFITFTSLFLLLVDGEVTLIQICKRPYVNGTIVSVIYGNIESPAYPDRYLGAHDCTVTVEIPSMSWIGIYIYEDFQIDRLSNDTCDDFVSISSPNDDSEVVEKCGSVQPSTLLFSKSSDASKEAVDVRFHSVENQRSSTQERFSITYKVADIIYPGWNNNHHRQAILNNVGYVVSNYGFTGKPEDTYGPNINSTLILTGFEPNTYIELYFASLSIHLEAECTDSLTIGGILIMVDFKEEYPGPLRICDSDQNNVIMYVKTVGTSMSFKFMTGPRGAKSGFLIQYRMTDSPMYDDTTNEFTTETITPQSFTTPSEKTDKFGDTAITMAASIILTGIIIIPITSLVAVVCHKRNLRGRMRNTIELNLHRELPVPNVDNMAVSDYDLIGDEYDLISESKVLPADAESGGIDSLGDVSDQISQHGLAPDDDVSFISRSALDVGMYFVESDASSNHSSGNNGPLVREDYAGVYATGSIHSVELHTVDS